MKTIDEIDREQYLDNLAHYYIDSGEDWFAYEVLKQAILSANYNMNDSLLYLNDKFDFPMVRHTIEYHNLDLADYRGSDYGFDTAMDSFKESQWLKKNNC